MTETQARQIIGVDPSADFAEIERVYSQQLQDLQLKLRPGNDMDTRKQVELQISRLQSAYDTLKQLSIFNFSPFAGRPASTPAKPAASVPNPAGTSAGYGNFSFSPLHVVIVAVTALFFFGILWTKLAQSSAVYEQSRTAFLRVASVPWCYVKVDDQYIGQSGSPEPVKILEGKHTLTFYKDGRTLSKTIEIKRQTTTFIKVQFDKGDIYVSVQ